MRGPCGASRAVIPATPIRGIGAGCSPPALRRTGWRFAALLVADHPRRPLAVAHAPPGAPLLSLPGDAPELVPRRRADERDDGPLPALRDERARVGTVGARRPGARRNHH